MTDSSAVSCYKLAHSLLRFKHRRAIDSHSRKTWFDPLQLRVGTVEDVFRRGARASIFRQRRPALVSSCSHCSCRVVQDVPGLSGLSIRNHALTGIQIRLYSRDHELSNQNVLHREVLAAPVVILSLVDNSLLVYSADNTLQHYLVVPTAETIKLHLCGSITFNGIIAAPNAVRMLSWMIPTSQKRE